MIVLVVGLFKRLLNCLIVLNCLLSKNDILLSIKKKSILLINPIVIWKICDEKYLQTLKKNLYKRSDNQKIGYKNEIFIGPKEELSKTSINLRDLNLLVEREEFSENILVKVRSTGKLLDAKIHIQNENFANVDLLNPEYGISPGQACVFYKKDQFGHKVLGGGWIKD